MEIEYSNTPKAPEKQEAKAGDLIKFSHGPTAIVLDEKTFITSKKDFAQTILLDYTNGENWSTLGTGYFQMQFQSGDYKILARAGDWHIKVDKRAEA